MQENTVSSAKVAAFIRSVVEAVVGASGASDVSTARVRFTDPDTQFNNLEWIMCDHCAAGEYDGVQKPERIWAHTNDFDFMAGSPLSFSAVEPADTRFALVEQITAFLCERFSRAQRVEIRLETDPTDYSRKQRAHSGDPAHQMFLDYVGDSESGMEGIKPFHSAFADLPA
jgi:hypothetical protein